MLRLSEEHHRMRKAEAAREQKIMHQQRQLLQKRNQISGTIIWLLWHSGGQLSVWNTFATM